MYSTLIHKLENWGYEILEYDTDIDRMPMLVIDARTIFGKVCFTNSLSCKERNREFITDTEEFLNKAKILMEEHMNRTCYKHKILEYLNIYLCIDKDGTEHMFQTDCSKNIIRTETKEWKLVRPDVGSHITLHQGTIETLIGSEMTWDCEPLEYTPKKNEEVKKEPEEEMYYWYIIVLQKDGGYRRVLQEANDDNKPHLINALRTYPGIVLNQIQITKEEYEYLKNNEL